MNGMKRDESVNDEQSNEEALKLDDTAIFGLMQLLTVAIATGTDVLDHLRMMELTRVEPTSNSLRMTDDFVKKTEEFVEQYMTRIDDAQGVDEPGELVDGGRGRGGFGFYD